jgi:drug/metabolite transporter (DMT)-like permease
LKIVLQAHPKISVSTSTFGSRHLTAAARPARRPRPRVALVGASCIAFSVVAIIALHALRPGLDPGRYAISQYAASGPYDWLATLALVAMGAGGVIVAAALRAQGPARRAWILVAVFGAAILVAAAFPISPPHGGAPPSEHVHGAAAFFAFAALTIAMLVYARAFRRDERLRRLARPSRTWGAIALVMLVGSDFVPAAGRGGYERAYLAVLLGWLLAVAWTLTRTPKRED